MGRKLSVKQEEILRRSRLIELRAKGMTERKISEELAIPRSTLHTDITVLKRQAAINIQNFIEKELPHEAELLLQNTTMLLQIAWTTLEKELQAGRAPYPAIDSIVKILNLREQLLDDKISLAINHKDEIEKNRIMDMEEQAYRGMSELKRHRSQAIFSDSDSPNYSRRPNAIESGHHSDGLDRVF